MHKNIVEHLLYEALIAVGRKILQVEGHLGPCEISMLCFFKKQLTTNERYLFWKKLPHKCFTGLEISINPSINQSSMNQYFFLANSIYH